jgi:hypothetical protein
MNMPASVVSPAMMASAQKRRVASMIQKSGSRGIGACRFNTVAQCLAQDILSIFVQRRGCRRDVRLFVVPRRFRRRHFLAHRAPPLTGKFPMAAKVRRKIAVVKRAGGEKSPSNRTCLQRRVCHDGA